MAVRPYISSNINIARDIVDFESLTVTSGAVVNLTATKIQPTGKRKRTGAIVFVTATDVRYRNDPLSAASTSAAGANAGPIVPAGSSISIDGHNNLSQAAFIATGADSTLKVFYYE
jgi:hypothetical protein